MKYLKPIIRKLTTNEDLISKSSTAKDDREILKILSEEVTIEEVEEVFTHHYGVEYKQLDFNEIDDDLVLSFDVEHLKKKSILPYKFNKDLSEWTFAISDLTNPTTKEVMIRTLEKSGQKAIFTFAFAHEIEDYYNRDPKEKVAPILNMGTDAISWVDAVLVKGIEIRASDIHIERQKGGLKVRYRVDGVMTGSQSFPMSDKEVSNVYVRLKVIGNMDISEKRRSQDGRIDNYKNGDNSYSMRVSTINTIHGEKFVMRIFDENGDTADFDDLGFSEEQIGKIMKMITKSNGIIYLAGATGSGKTTTLYAMINRLDKENMNIYTIENPSEKTIEGVNQVQVDEASKNTYPSVLKTLLRQDPDVMVVGEIRETETAKIAVEASLTGHLVMTTVHANNAVDAINRLIEMQVESYLIGASSVGFLSQRLVRVLCPHCKKKVENLSEYQKQWLSNGDSYFTYEVHKQKGEYIYEAAGCDKCVSGYKGRVAVLEIIEVDNNLRDLISRKASTKEIRDYLKTVNYKEMKSDGVKKAFEGITSVEELMGKLQN